MTFEALYPAASTTWGRKFNKDEVNLQPFGTFTITWTGCEILTFEYDSVVNGFDSFTRSYTRISRLLGTSCPQFP